MIGSHKVADVLKEMPELCVGNLLALAEPLSLPRTLLENAWTETGVDHKWLNVTARYEIGESEVLGAEPAFVMALIHKRRKEALQGQAKAVGLAEETDGPLTESYLAVIERSFLQLCGAFAQASDWRLFTLKNWFLRETLVPNPPAEGQCWVFIDSTYCFERR